VRYQINIVRELRLQEQRAERRRVVYSVLTVAGFGLLGLSLFYAVLQALPMEATLEKDRREVSRLESEYRQYRQTEAIIEKEDVELLDNIQRGRVYWTRKLLALANHLPDGYRIESIKSDKDRLTVRGTGEASRNQNQLIVLNDYLASLKADPQFGDAFGRVYLTSSSVSRGVEGGRVAFEFAAER